MTGVVISECELPRPILIVVAIHQFLDRLRRGVEELGEMQLRAINKCDDTAELGLVARTYLRAEINIENEGWARIAVQQRPDLRKVLAKGP